MKGFNEIAPGVLLATILALFSIFMGGNWPVVGGPIFAISIGVFVRNCIGLSDFFNKGLDFSSKIVLRWSIILLGFGINLNQVAKIGVDSLWVTLITIFVAFFVAFFLGKALNVTSKLKSLIGVGTAICGGAAIAAISPIIKPNDHDVSLALSTIFLFNICAVIVFPFFGHFLGMSSEEFGLWAGTAINDTSSVVAAAYSYSVEAGDYATVVKLTRATLIIPICIAYMLLEIHNQKSSGSKLNVVRLIPWFIVGFVAASAMRTIDVLPLQLLDTVQFLAKFLMILALAAIGLASNLKVMLRTGWRPVVLGLGVWGAVTITSLIVQWRMGG